MLDLKFIRENPEIVRKNLKDRGTKLDLEKFLLAEKQWRSLLKDVEQKKCERNIVTEKIAQWKKEEKDTKEFIEEMRLLSAKIKEEEKQVNDLQAEIKKTLLFIPNIPEKDVPLGRQSQDNKEIRKWGKISSFAFPLRPHWEIAQSLEMIDFARAVRIAGAHFALYKNWGAIMERALINFMLDLHRRQGYIEISPPYLVNRATITGTGQLPKYEEDMYHCPEDDFFLVPTAEVPLISLHKDEILHSSVLPLKYTAYSPCFRREAGSYGKETHGLLRVHQFDKVELVKFAEPENSEEELEKMVREAEEVVQALEIPYRVMLLCAGELGFAASRCYDLEAWAPAQNTWLEISSCSNCREFQARRLNIKYRKEAQARPQHLHTLNGSGVALARTMAAILENYQQEDGSLVIPAALQPYMNGLKKIQS